MNCTGIIRCNYVSARIALQHACMTVWVRVAGPYEQFL